MPPKAHADTRRSTMSEASIMHQSGQYVSSLPAADAHDAAGTAGGSPDAKHRFERTGGLTAGRRRRCRRCRCGKKMGMHALPRTNVSFGWLEEAVTNLHGRLYKPMMPRREWEVPGYRPSLRTSSLPTSSYIYSYRLLVWHSSGFLPVTNHHGSSPGIWSRSPLLTLRPQWRTDEYGRRSVVRICENWVQSVLLHRMRGEDWLFRSSSGQLMRVLAA